MSPHHLKSLGPRISPAIARQIAAACGIGVLALGATACGSAEEDRSGSVPNRVTDSAGQGDRTGPAGRFPGANGKVAAVTGDVAQVQGQDGQVAVTWNGSTTFTQQVGAKLSDVTVGSCVMVQPDTDDTGASGDTTQVTAATVRITEKSSDGTCSGGPGGPGGPGGLGGGELPGFDPNGTPPEGMGTPPDGAQPPSGGFPGIRGAFGEVTAISSTGFTVLSGLPQAPAGSGSTPNVEETSVTVTVSTATTYTTTGEASAADVAVGICLLAEGTTDSTGAVTAETIALSPTTDGDCGTVFRRAAGAPGEGS